MYTEIAERYIRFLKATSEENTRPVAGLFLSLTEEWNELDVNEVQAIVSNLLTIEVQS